MQLITAFALALSLVANVAPVAGNPMALAELRSIMDKRDVCGNFKCKNNGECWKKGCELGCNGKKCHPLVTMCPRNCKIHKRDDGVIEIIEAREGDELESGQGGDDEDEESS